MQTIQVDPTVTPTFDRTSESNILLLVSQLSVKHITGHLNGTKVNCTEHTLGNIILQKEIHIIDTNNSKLNLKHHTICNTFYIAIYYIIIICHCLATKVLLWANCRLPEGV